MLTQTTKSPKKTRSFINDREFRSVVYVVDERLAAREHIMRINSFTEAWQTRFRTSHAHVECSAFEGSKKVEQASISKRRYSSRACGGCGKVYPDLEELKA